MRLKRYCALILIVVLLAGIALPALAEYSNPYYIDVDITNQIVTIYNTADDSIKRQMICSTGVHDSTPLGVFYMPKIWNLGGVDRTDRNEWHWFDVYFSYAKWASRISGSILFHSVIYDTKDKVNQKSVRMLGSKASHGCIRLPVDDAKFIAKNCLSGTRVTIFESGELNEGLRTMLKYKTYKQEDGISYEDFIAYSETGLGVGSEGEEVSNLQHRLQDLGYFKGEITGSYDPSTIEAVRAVQNDLGVHASGTVERELSEILYSDDAPLAAQMAPLEEGRSGPAVRKFQLALQKLGFYSEDIDSIYDAGVIESVKRFQELCGYLPDGNASTEIQHLVYFELDKITKALGTDEFTMEWVDEPVIKGTINSKLRVNVRKKASQKSNLLGQLKSGDEVMMFGSKDGWAKIYVNGVIGYVLRNTLDTHEGSNLYARYTANGKSATLGGTSAEIEAGTAANPAAELRAYNEEHKDYDYLGQEEEYITVNTGDDSVMLNMRNDSSSEGAVLAQIPNGTTLRALTIGDEWTCVNYEDQVGYLMNRYLEFGADESLYELQSVDAYDDTEYVVVAARDGAAAKLFAEPDEGSAAVKSLENGAKLELLTLNEGTGWAQVTDGSAEGYIQGANIQFTDM